MLNLCHVESKYLILLHKIVVTKYPNEPKFSVLSRLQHVENEELSIRHSPWQLCTILSFWAKRWADSSWDLWNWILKWDNIKFKKLNGHTWAQRKQEMTNNLTKGMMKQGCRWITLFITLSNQNVQCALDWYSSASFISTLSISSYQGILEQELVLMKNLFFLTWIYLPNPNNYLPVYTKVEYFQEIWKVLVALYSFQAGHGLLFAPAQRCML